jgi:hypothetical protein
VANGEPGSAGPSSGGPGSGGPGSGGPGSGGLGILTAQATPESARRIWPWWLALGIGAIAVAVAALFLVDDGARLLVGAFGAALTVRGVLLLRAARSLSADLVTRAKGLGAAALAAGVVTLLIALISTGADRFLLVAVPLVLLAAGSRGRRALLAVAVAVSGLIVGLGVVQGWDRAAEAATVVTALIVAGLGVPLVVAAAHLRTIAARPAPAAPAGCAGCACGAGGCGS